MWKTFEARLDENDPKYAAQRQNYLELIRSAGLRPGDGHAKKMLPFKFGADERLLWGIEGSAQNFYLCPNWQGLLAENGITTRPRAFDENKGTGGGRHTGLNSSWAFGKDACLVVSIDGEEALRQLLGVLLQSGDALALNPAAITRWIDRLRSFFPTFERFDIPDVQFDDAERTYKLENADELKRAIAQHPSDQELANAINAVFAKSNLLQWRVYWPMSAKGDADRDRLWPALRALVDGALGPAGSHAAALEAFVHTWIAAVPDGKPDPARQIAEFLLLHLAPNDGIYIRHSVRQDLWLESVGSRFPDHPSMADTYRDERRFMQAVFRAFADRGLAPRDMIDIQSALWIVHNYKEEDAVTFSREAIEAAMDAYDSYRQSGEHASSFEPFAGPHENWVRSTRQRTNRVYPSKPIVGFLRGKTEINDGWRDKGDAASQLHNAGYIVVDGANLPVTPPQGYAHLIGDADRIRLCARNYYIEPSRENGMAEAAIRAGDLGRDMGLRDAFPVICSALGGEKFQKLANVPEPSHTLPNPSSSTVFTYLLSTAEGHQSMSFAPLTEMSHATNLILYGPPGTGKTYSTALNAVRLCLGDAVAEPLREDRDALMAEYRRLVAEGRIEFVTFHQSFSYEDFVEGLRPTTASEQEGVADSPGLSVGFSLKPHAGVFKTISERARLDTGDTPAKRLDRSRQIYKIALGRRGSQEDWIREGLDHGLIHLGWGGDIDWSDERFDDFEEIRKTWKEEKDTDASGKDPNIETLYSFRAGLQVGDYVVISDGRDSYRAFGRVTSDYYFDPDASFHPHRRRIDWIWRDKNGAERAPFYARYFRQQSVYRLDPDLIDWDALEAVVVDPHAERPVAEARPYVLIIDEINRANISKVFGELITLLEVDKRLGCENEIRVRLPYSGTLFGVPANLHVIGTMNTADRSIALLDTALRRRFTFLELMPDIDKLRRALANRGLDAANLQGIDLCRLLNTINERIEYLFDREHQIGHAYFTNCRNRADVEEVIRHKVIPLLAEYFYEDWSKVAAVLGDSADAKFSRFVEARRLAAPIGFGDDELGGDKIRWSVKASFDFSDFAA
ncbi:AAA family ATPase [Agrobacterium cavarae]|uniref:AAA family ATPase n=1 Tax=Agrobacterium cavarae TaxID=2528239 RepID=UPI003FD1AAF5